MFQSKIPEYGLTHSSTLTSNELAVRRQSLKNGKAKTTAGDEMLTERNQLSRQNAACFISARRTTTTKNEKSPLEKTDDAFFELDDSECSVPSSPTSPEATNPTPSINVPLPPPMSAPPCPQNGPPSEKSPEMVSLSTGGTPTISQPEDSLLRTRLLHHTNVTQINSECKLQQSLSTPCNTDDVAPARKESEYRRFKSEGSSAGQTLPPNGGPEVHMDELSPVDQRSGSRYPLMPQDSVANPTPITKQSHTEQVAMMHTLKTKLSKYQAFIDRAFDNILKNTETDVIEGCTIITKLMKKAWATPKVSVDLSISLCDYLRDRDYFDKMIKIFISATCDPVRLASGKVLEECMSRRNRDFIVNKNYTKKIITILTKMTKNLDQQRLGLSLMEALFEHSNQTSLSLIECGVLDTVLLTVRTAANSPETLRYASLALANLALHCCSEGKKKLVSKKIPEWLFVLASQSDDVTRYYACLATCTIASSHESEVRHSTTMQVTDRFVNSHQPDLFSREPYKHLQGRPKEWIKRLLPLLKSSRKEAKTIAAFHLAMEAYIKKEQNKLDIFQEIGAIQALKEVASSPNEVAAKFASEALTVIGEEVPYKLAQQVPSWTADDVQYWVKKIGFEEYVDQFAKQKVDGDLLLHLTEHDLDHDIGMKSGLHRKRFVRELESLKIAADYSSVDESNLDQFLMSLSPELSVYTYQMLSNGVNRSLLSLLTDDLMQNACGITNPIHRLKLIKAFENAKHPDDVEVAMLSKQIDVFISYRRSTGNQLASLIKVLLQLRGYKVFIDVDRLSAGNFDSYLLKNIQAAKHFILVLTPKAFDRLLNDENCEDWIHKELRCAFEHHKNIIPIFDQQFEFPTKESQIPEDIRMITKINGVKWVHDYQEACMAKVVRFIDSELNRNPYKTFSLGSATKKPTPISKTSWNNSSGRTPSAAKALSARMEPTTPTFVTPSNSQDKVRRRGIQSSISTVSDRAV